MIKYKKTDVKNKSSWDKMSHKYNTMWVQKYSLQPTRRKILALLKDMGRSNIHMLDIGCATGQLLSEVQKEMPNWQIFGIDKSQDMLAVAKENNNKISFECVAAENYETDKIFDIITCCHSFPYYSNKELVLKRIHTILSDDGRAIFIHASSNSLYDRFIMWIIEKTAETADYLPHNTFMKLVAPYFIVDNTFKIKEKWFMPSICGYVLRKKI